MTDQEVDPIAEAIGEHGDQLGRNLAKLKGFLQAEREAQEKFLAEQREASDRAQEKAHRTARWAMLATFFAAAAAGFQAYAAYVSLG